MLGSSERAVKPERMPHELLVRKHDRVRGNWYFGGRAGVVLSTGYPSCMIILIRLSVLLVQLHRLFSTSQVRLATYNGCRAFCLPLSLSASLFVSVLSSPS